MLEGERAAPGQCYHGWVRNAEQIRRELTKERKGGGKKKAEKKEGGKKKQFGGLGFLFCSFGSLMPCVIRIPPAAVRLAAFPSVSSPPEDELAEKKCVVSSSPPPFPPPNSLGKVDGVEMGVGGGDFRRWGRRGASGAAERERNDRNEKAKGSANLLTRRRAEEVCNKKSILV